MSHRLLVFILATVATVAAQQPPPPVAYGVSVSPEKIIDGAKQPDRIPDTIAWWHLFMVLADKPGAPAYSARSAFLDPGAFSSEEVELIIQAANEAILEVKDMERRVSTLYATASMDYRTAQLRSGRENILRSVVSKLMQQLGSDGAPKFQAHVRDSVKSRIKMVDSSN